MNIISQLSPPTRFGRHYRDEILHSRNVVTYLGANVTEIEAPGDGAQVSAVRVRTLAGGTFQVSARTFVLATGGIETPRLLLASNRYQPRGIGNQHDLVGRYFMDHPRLRSGTILFRDPAANSSIYDLHYTLPGGITAHGVKIAAYFGLTPETQRAERLGNTRCYAVSRYVGDDPAAYTAVSHIRQAVHGAGSLLDRSRSDIFNMVKQLPSVAVLAAGLKLRLPFLARGFALETVVEPTPLPESRVTLGTGRDGLGMPRVKVEWRLGELEKRTIRRTQEILGEDIQRVGGGAVTVDAPGEDEDWPDTLARLLAPHGHRTHGGRSAPRGGRCTVPRAWDGEPVHRRQLGIPDLRLRHADNHDRRAGAASGGSHQSYVHRPSARRGRPFAAAAGRCFVSLMRPIALDESRPVRDDYSFGRRKVRYDYATCRAGSGHRLSMPVLPPA